MQELQKSSETLCAPVSGTVRKQNGGAYVIDITDEENGDVVSPVGGIVTRIGECGNRIAICSNGGNAVSVGIGLARPGRSITADGCHFYVQEGEHINAGQRLMHASLSHIRRMGGTSECVMTLGGDVGIRESVGGGGTVRAGVTPLLRVEDTAAEASFTE